MKATELDFETECRACANGLEKYDTCPACGDGKHSHADTKPGIVNRLQSAKDGHIRIDERVSKHGYVIIEEIPIRDENTGGFEGRYDDWTPKDVTTGPMADYQPDTLDRLQNQSANSEYRVYGQIVKAENTFNKNSTDPDLDVDEVIAWVGARGDTHTKSLFEKLKKEMGTK